MATEFLSLHLLPPTFLDEIKPSISDLPSFLIQIQQEICERRPRFENDDFDSKLLALQLEVDQSILVIPAIKDNTDDDKIDFLILVRRMEAFDLLSDVQGRMAVVG